LCEAALSLSRFERNAVEKKFVIGNAEQEPCISALWERLLKFGPSDLELALGTLVGYTIKPGVLHQNVEAVKKRPSGRATASIGVCYGSDNSLLSPMDSSDSRLSGKVTYCTITEVIGPINRERIISRKDTSLRVRATLVARLRVGSGVARSGARMSLPDGHSRKWEAFMKIGVLFFGMMKDVAGRAAESLDLPDGALVRDVLLYYSRNTPRFEAMLPSLAISVNREYAAADRQLRDGDEVGLLPPVSGGAPSGDDSSSREASGDESGILQIVREPIDLQALISRLKHPEDGATVIFDGIVRNNTRGRRTLYLEYEAYEAMALQQMEALASEARKRFAVRAISIVHRLGRLEIGETSVLIVVASAHRGAAFDACRWIIDTLKKTVPIWKKEYFEDGVMWADGEPFPEEFRRPGATSADNSAS